VSASHTKDDLDRLLCACDEIGDVLQLKFSSGIAGESIAPTKVESNGHYDKVSPSMDRVSSPRGIYIKPRWNVEEVIRRGVIDTTA
jgi:serine palmitoyltransferase